PYALCLDVSRFLGTPFFHSMVARAQAFTSDISVLIDLETILLTDFISTLNYAYKVDHDWLLVASSRNVSSLPFYLSDDGKNWQRKDGKTGKGRYLFRVRIGIRCDGRMLMAWNRGELPLHTEVLPPFLYGKGIHDPWVISEALSYEFRFVFDASWTGLPVFSDPSTPSNISFDDCDLGTKCFQRVSKAKSRMVLHILKLGYNVLLSDVDVYWFKNPLPLLYSFGPSVLAAESDEYNVTGPINLPWTLNSGFYFACCDASTIAAMEKVVKHAATSNLSEQPSFYDTLCGEGGSNRVGDNRCMEPETNLTIHFLDRNLFPNGAYLGLWEKKNVKQACEKKGCFVLHNNWFTGRLRKLERQLLSDLWEYDISTRMCMHSWHRTNSEICT
ncbi:hypothetical protein Dsin_010443, partial [Dipteronia sinensis]